MPALFVGRDLRIVAANSRAVELAPRAAEHVPLVMVFRQPPLTQAIEDCLRSATPQQARYVHTEGPHESRYDVRCAYVPGDGFEGVLACFEDVTQLRQTDQIRRDFVANVSHELRTPLTALLGYIETLQGPAREDAAARERFLTSMQAEAQRMNRLVGDLLSLSRVEDEARMRPTDRVDVAAVAGQAVRRMMPLAQEGGVTLAAEMPEEGMVLPGDHDQLLQVFTNLIENAIKYGGRGADVTVSAGPVDRDPYLRKPAVRIDVRDTGAGFDPLHIPRLTERFYRVDSHRSREKGGTGLGLAIVKHIVNRHRGRLRIESAPGQGSLFSVILPRE